MAENADQLKREPDDLARMICSNFCQYSLLFKALGQILSRLREPELEYFLNLKNLLLISPQSSGGAVQKINISGRLCAGEWILVTFDNALSDMKDFDIAVGVIVHELAHVYLKHHEDEPYSSPADDKEWFKMVRKRQSQEPEADALATMWGFGYEIRKTRGY